MVLEGGGGGAGWLNRGGGGTTPRMFYICATVGMCTTPKITKIIKSFFGCSLYILHMTYNQISLVTFNLILMTFQCKTCWKVL